MSDITEPFSSRTNSVTFSNSTHCAARASSIAIIFAAILAGAPHAAETGVKVPYQLPLDGPLPKTYCVTLAIVDPKNPDWIVSTFVAAQPRTVTAENQGKFAETWDGLDENFMPVPPGDYGVKGIYMPAQKWRVDGEWHSVTPKFVGGASAWMPSPEQWDKPEPFGGDPTRQPLGDVAVGPNGVAVFGYVYLENGTNNPLIDLKKPLGYDQFIRAFNSGGAAGGSSVATDGESVWGFSTDGGKKFVYRADGKPFGDGKGANRNHVYLPTGWVTAMAAGKDAQGKTVLCVAQRGKIVEPHKGNYEESKTEFVDAITIHDGADGKVLAELPLARPQGIAIRAGVLYALHADGAGMAVSFTPLNAAAQAKTWTRAFAVPETIHPEDMEIDSHGRFYFSDSMANKVFELDGKGKILLTFGQLSEQKSGGYDPLSFMSPGKLATWTDDARNDHLIVVEKAGPNRASEWSAEGKLEREFLTLQTMCNDGYTFDPEHPEHLYIPGQQHWLTRFKVDYAHGTFVVDAVWPNVGNDPRAPNLDKPQLIRANGKMYLAAGRSYNVYRLDGDRWLLSAALLHENAGGKARFAFWHDSNGNGRVDDDEVAPAELPGHFTTYHGQNWLDDLSMLAINQGGQDVWRLAPSGFDAHGNPIFKEFTKLFSDPIFEARAAGKADAVHGGNELAVNFASDWMQGDGSLADGFFIQARGGKNFSANEGPQHKITRYVPDGKDGYQLKWRAGRTALARVTERGEMYGGMRVHKPVNGLLSVVDQSRCGILLYTESGLYVDTIFPDDRRGFTPKTAGVYPQPGEFFAGTIVPNKDNGKIYFAMGKYTPTIFEAEGWSLRENPVRELDTVQRSVTISAAQIAQPPEIALTLRGGAGTAKFARFTPALGDAAIDGSMSGWESAEPVLFQADKDQHVEVRCQYRPDELLLRWHARMAAPFVPKPLPPLERIFTHDQLADTLSFYIQGDVNAKPGGALEGRPGDARFVFGIFNQDGKAQPVALGLYPDWAGKGTPQIYRTPVGSASFAHAGAVAGIKLGHAVDADGKGFVLAAAIPRAAIPAMRQPFNGGLRTLVDFEATFGGHNKFWWANSDGSASRETFDEPTEARLYPGAWAQAQFQGLNDGVLVRNWLIAGPFGGPGAEKFKADLSGTLPGTNKDMKQAGREFCDAAAYDPDSGKVDLQAAFKGPSITGYWPDPREVRWKPVSVADLDKRVILGTSAQVWYGATWIRVPAETELEFRFQGHLMTHLRWSLNGQPIAIADKEYIAEKTGSRTVAVKKLKLREGWNQILFRGYCVGYPHFRAGLELNGPPEKLWTLSLSGTPH